MKKDTKQNYIQMSRKSLKNGFTLVETLVSIGVFTVIMSIAISALLTIVDANAKAQSIKTAVNNINFAMDLVTTALQTSTAKITCLDEVGTLISGDACPNGSRGISFYSQKSGGGLTRYFIWNKEVEGTNRLLIKIGNGPTDEFEELLPASINIDNEKVFYVTKSEGIPFVTMVLSGTIKNKGSSTQFNLQTNISKVGI